eukprot:TRINITY_DN30978_c0_g1_i1.p1 TRINITY_DN30978_c0_g1~~TRINITY_DN30978_c0_g1_i1.p1  ORF type:complete len:801 (+),score=209.27 TRINITY_DN30978_c0_g1_i1:76-2478(+)
MGGSKRKKGGGKGRKGDGKGGRQPRPEADDAAAESSDAGDSEARAKKARKDKGGKQDVWRESGPVTMENASFEAYYKRQAVCPEGEWSQLLESLRTGLPVALRVNGMRAGATALGARLREMRTACVESERSHYAPEQLPWYPGGAAWQWKSLERKTIKKDPVHARLKDFLAQRERSGLITRQEVVSMLPPLFLEPEPHHMVLDLCAAPGSKTSQIVELMHSGSTAPTGLVVANELQWRRANMLAHQVGRLGSPCAAVVNMDAQFFPELWEVDSASGASEPAAASESAEAAARPLRFDRILADVPCSGDGTMRKTPYIWSSWTRLDGLSLHIRQLNILYRGLDMLRVGGRLVYSTCSLNPMEDEAVVAAALLRFGDALALVPRPAALAGLKVGEGLQTWVVPSPAEDGVVYEDYADVPTERRSGKNRLLPSMFAPKAGEEHTDRILAQVKSCCCRMLPHLMDTGGFFVAAFEKKAEFRPSAKVRRNAARQQPRAGKGEEENAAEPGGAGAEEPAAADEPMPEGGDADETAAAAATDAGDDADGKAAASTAQSAGPQKPANLRPISREYGKASERMAADDLAEVAAFYGFDEALLERIFLRGNAERQMYLQSPGAARFLRAQARLPTRMVLTGVLTLQRSESYHVRACPWQLVQEGLSALCSTGGLHRRRLRLRRPLLRRLLAERELTLAEVQAAVPAGDAEGLQTCASAEGDAGTAPGSLRPGSVAVELIPDGDAVGAPRVVLAALISEAMLECSASNADMAALLEDLGEQPCVEDILGPAEEAAPAEAPASTEEAPAQAA